MRHNPHHLNITHIKRFVYIFFLDVGHTSELDLDLDSRSKSKFTIKTAVIT